MRRLALLLLLPLAACATPLEKCQRAAREELNTVTLLIAETEQNIARGYAIQRETVERPNLQVCFGETVDDNVGIVFCNETITKIVETPVAIDPAAEQRKLAALKARQADLIAESEAALTRCAAIYP